jgi:hypothetical protein
MMRAKRRWAGVRHMEYQNLVTGARDMAFRQKAAADGKFTNCRENNSWNFL